MPKKPNNKGDSNFVSRKDLRKNKKIEKKKHRQVYNQKKQDYALYKNLEKSKPKAKDPPKKQVEIKKVEKVKKSKKHA